MVLKGKTHMKRITAAGKTVAVLTMDSKVVAAPNLCTITNCVPASDFVGGASGIHFDYLLYRSPY
jgi:hypothetical protein